MATILLKPDRQWGTYTKSFTRDVTSVLFTVSHFLLYLEAILLN